MDAQALYRKACALAAGGEYERATRLYRRLESLASDSQLKALICNDQAAIAAVRGDGQAAERGFAVALETNAACQVAQRNIEALKTVVRSGSVGQARDDSIAKGRMKLTRNPGVGPTRIAVLSFLFNWPSTGGGTVHTAELCRFLCQAGYEVRHYFARYPAWGIGGVLEDPGHAASAIDFEDSTWNLRSIQSAYRREVDAFAPDTVVITDCWNFKPWLAEAVSSYPYVLRQQALECLCPLNNLRFLVEHDGSAVQCPLHQLATPGSCARCLQERGGSSGALHQLERSLSMVGTPEYDVVLRRALREAEAVLVLNPLIKEMLSPYCKSVRVVTWGMDSQRFPWPPSDEPSSPFGEPRPSSSDAMPGGAKPITRLLFAGLVPEMIKGFHVLQDACERLWGQRQDFELLATADPPGQVNAFTRYIGWQSQDQLPRFISAADVLVMPTVAQEGLGRTTVEAMAVGRPVVASRIGGLPYTVTDGFTGLLCEPGDAADLAAKIGIMLDDRALRVRMGLAGRRRFEQEFTWEQVIERHYRPLFAGVARGH